MACAQCGATEGVRHVAFGGGRLALCPACHARLVLLLAVLRAVSFQ